ncbi:hypothetical protein [Geodermatophilus sp. URMC 63]
MPKLFLKEFRRDVIAIARQGDHLSGPFSDAWRADRHGETRASIPCSRSVVDTQPPGIVSRPFDSGLRATA